jgi:hypothetical protein
MKLWSENLHLFISFFCVFFQRVSEALSESKQDEDSLNEELQDPDLLYEKVRE